MQAFRNRFEDRSGGYVSFVDFFVNYLLLSARILIVDTFLSLYPYRVLWGGQYWCIVVNVFDIGASIHWGEHPAWCYGISTTELCLCDNQHLCCSLLKY